MLRDQVDNDEFCRRGRAQRGGLEIALAWLAAEDPPPPVGPPFLYGPPSRPVAGARASTLEIVPSPSPRLRATAR